MAYYVLCVCIVYIEHWGVINLSIHFVFPFGVQEFEVTLEKVGGSLGFTLRQEDTSILGHFVRALVKDPALSDGRIQPGDKILSVSTFTIFSLSPFCKIP